MTNKFNVNETLEVLSCWDLTGSKNDELNQNAVVYNTIYNNHDMYLTNICSNLFKWNNLPDYEGIPLRSSFVEMVLSLNGGATFANLPSYGVIYSPATPVGLLNIAGEPVEIMLSGSYAVDRHKVLGDTLKRDKDKFIYIRNDNLAIGFFPLIMQTAKMLSDILMSFITNVSQQKFPLVFYGDKDTKMTLNIIQNKIDAWEKYIQIKKDGGFEDSSFGVLNKNVPFVADKLYQSYIDVLNNFFMRIGINNIPNAKKERLLKDEVNANNQAVITAGDIYLNNRVEGAKQANDMFGFNITVERNTDFIESLKADVNGEFDRQLNNSISDGGDYIE